MLHQMTRSMRTYCCHRGFIRSMTERAPRTSLRLVPAMPVPCISSRLCPCQTFSWRLMDYLQLDQQVCKAAVDE
jgi:hypothetical protein